VSGVIITVNSITETYHWNDRDRVKGFGVADVKEMTSDLRIRKITWWWWECANTHTHTHTHTFPEMRIRRNTQSQYQETFILHRASQDNRIWSHL